MTANQDASGRLLADRYRLVSVLGRGGMGTVWRAVDEVLGRPVAVKELRFAAGVDEDERRRLIARTLTEAKAIARVRHTAAITVYDVVEEDDRPWIVMELVESRSLSEVISSEGVLPPLRAAEIGLELLAVLAQAHRSGILHRDVKPSNVLIGHDGRVVLTDFGIARVEGDPSVTSTGMLVGAPSYISPERARGRVPGAPADLWSLGATMYAMVEGHPPYDKGSALSTLTAVMTEELVPPANGGSLAPVIAGLLRKDPEQRFDEPTTRQLLLRVLAEAETEPQLQQPQPQPQPSLRAQPPLQPPLQPPRFEPQPQPQPRPRARPTATGGPGYDLPTQRLREPAPAVGYDGGGFDGGAYDGGDGPRTEAMPLPGGPSEPLAARLSAPQAGDPRSRRRLARVLVALLALLLVAGGGVWVAMAQQTKPGLAAGFERAAVPGGGTIDIPKGWTITRLATDRWRYRGAAGTLVVAWTGTPGSSALAELASEESRDAGSYPHYRQLQSQSVSYRSWNAADWAWSYTGSGGEALRSVEREFVVDGQDGYSIDWTASASGWDGSKNRDLLAGFYSTFQPGSR
ncbi:serine/threonine-protein kinase [Streptacidiphilus sp. P02-A3a]|uniref:serine/threonine-protein kinase n=1 Tax=Streptacidiphilus sp. P02-A3a TaxID=2704468 RepID=UPI0015FDCE9C|nr:serine/threonine-protein kinase [Streptacidiphilus sp. P02-A3a]QMU72683.1 serine/threonine protein kinase [Streptacidiphilus sp. P02-A3a]